MNEPKALFSSLTKKEIDDMTSEFNQSKVSKEPFYMIWREGSPSPRKKHFMLMDALAEAERLAHENPNIDFFVLEAKHLVRSFTTIETTDLK